MKKMVFGFLLGLCGALLSPAALALPDEAPQVDLMTTDLGQEPWWCPAENYGKANLVWPEKHQDKLATIKKNVNTYELAKNFAADTKWAKAARAVGRLDILVNHPGRGKRLMSTCTATVISYDHILTNRHCVVDANTSLISAELRMGYLDENTPGETFAVDLNVLEIDEERDYAILGVFGNPGAKYGSVEFRPRAPESGEEVFIVHHPAGIPKRVTRGCHLAPFPVGDVSFYSDCNFEPGSSGSPMFAESDSAIVGLNFAYFPPEKRHLLSIDIGPFYFLTKTLSELVKRSETFPKIVPRLRGEDGVTDYWITATAVGLAKETQVWFTAEHFEGEGGLFEFIEAYNKNGYMTDSVKYSTDAKRWAVVMTLFPKGYTQHLAWRRDWSRIADYMNEMKAAGFSTSHFVAAEGHYLAIMDGGDSFPRGDQQAEWTDEYPSESFEEYRKKGYYLEALTYDEKDSRWYSIFSQNANGRPLIPWTWAVDKKFPTEKVHDLWQDGYRIWDVEHSGGVWTVIMYRNPNGGQTWQGRAWQPNVVLREFQRENGKIQFLVPGKWNFDE